jgi:hypothetical protein
MSDYSGRKIRIGLAKEATRATYAAPTYWMRWETADIFDMATTQFNQSAIGVLDRYSGAEIMQRSGTGQLAGKITDQSVGLLLYGIYGTHSVATHSGETTVYDHTFTESQSNVSQSLSVTRVDPNTQYNFVNGMVGSFELDAKAGDFVRHTTNFTTFPSAVGSGATPVFVAENEFKGKHVTTAIASTVGGLTSATAIPVNSVKLTINKNITPYWIIGQDGPIEIFSQSVEVTGEFVLRYTDSTYYNLRFNNTVQAMQIVVANTDVAIGVVPSHPTLTFVMPAAYMNDFKPETGIDGMVTQTVSFTATYSIAAGYAVQSVLTNTIATY